MVNFNRKMSLEEVQGNIDDMIDESDCILEDSGSIEPLEVVRLRDIAERLIRYASHVAVNCRNPIFLRESDRAFSAGIEILGFVLRIQKFLTLREDSDFCPEYFG